MRLRWCASVVFLLLSLAVSAWSDQGGGSRYQLEVREVVPGVFVAQRPDPLRPYVEGNVTFIINDRDVVVVDASGSPRMARMVIEAIRARTTNPVSYLVHTHIHRDHRFGAQEYLREFPGVEIIAHPIVTGVVSGSGDSFVHDTIERLEKSAESLRTEIETLESGDDEDRQVASMLRRYVERDLPVMLDEYRDIRNVAPTMSVDDRLVLHRDRRRIEVRFLGRGDTDHDLVVWLPDDGVVCAGDMVVHPFPYGFSEYPREWIETMKVLESMEFRYLVPGHGEVQRGKRYLQDVIRLVETVQEQVGARVAAGESPEQIVAGIDLRVQEQRFAGSDPILRYYFGKYFVEPAVREAINSTN